MLVLKQGVDLTGVRPEIVLAMSVAAGVYDTHARADCIITSVNDGRHSRTSRHYVGLACDIRTKNLPDLATKRKIREQLALALGYQFDVVLEYLDTHNEHIHVEFDPKSSATF